MAYEELEEVGHGGSCRVYRARGPDGRIVAIKRLREDHHALEPARLRREAALLRKAAHPAVLELVAFVPEPLALVLEWADGGTLEAASRAREVPFTAAEAVRVLLPIAHALAGAHALGVVHRDVKPSNVLSVAGVWKLSDFGIGRQEGVTQLTMGGMGTMAFMPPEQRIDAHVAGPSADVYALGATLYALVTRRTPMDIGFCLPESPRWGFVPSGLRAALQWAMHPEADRRPSMAEFIAALERAAVSEGSEVPSAPPRVGRVMFAEDDPHSSAVLEALLRKMGAEVTAFGDGRSLYDAAKRTPPDLILLDNHMPVWNGVQALAALRDHPPTSRVPVLMLTAEGSEAAIVAAFEAGADDYLTRPVRAPILEARVRRMLDRVARR
jgi:serine/threonine protein kinase